MAADGQLMAKPFNFLWHDFVNSENGPVSTTDRAVAGALFKRMDKDGRCFPSAATLAKDCRRSERQVWRSIDSLKRVGLLVVPTKRKTRNGTSGFMVNVYQGLIPNIDKKLSTGRANPPDTSVIDKENPPDKIGDPPDTGVTFPLTPVSHELPYNSHIELPWPHADACPSREKEEKKEESSKKAGTYTLLLSRLRHGFDGDPEEEATALVDRFGMSDVSTALVRAMLERPENFHAELVATLEDQRKVPDAPA
jgi:hypothetical protein